MPTTRKSRRRTAIVEHLATALKSPAIYRTLDYRQKSESSIKQYMHRIILDRLCSMHRELCPGLRDETLRRKAEDSLFWEGDVTTTINNFLFLGVQHRPDFKVRVDGLWIAVEVKRGESGSAVREGLGQALVYSHEFDFVVYLFVDTSRDKKIVASLSGAEEHRLVERLWNHDNIRFEVV